MTTYKLFRVRKGKLYPLFVETDREMEIGVWLEAHVGELVDETHVKSRLGPLSLRPGIHSCTVPFTDWIGKKKDGKLIQRKDTIWCECEVDGPQIEVFEKNGLRTIPQGWYFFCTKPSQPFPWIISDRIKIVRTLTRTEVEIICQRYGIRAQEME